MDANLIPLLYRNRYTLNINLYGGMLRELHPRRKEFSSEEPEKHDVIHK